MNLLVVCHYGLYRNFASSFVHAQAREYVRLGHRVRVIVPVAVMKRDWDGKRDSGSGWRTEDGVELYALRFLSLSNYGVKHFNTASAVHALKKRLGTVLDGFEPDVIQAHTLGLDSGIGAWLKERLHIPLVVTTHGSDTSIPVEQGRGAELKALCDRADAVVAVSSVLAEKVRSCGTGVPVSSILNGFRLDLMPEKIERQSASLLQVSALQEQKRPHITIQAFARLRERHPECVLTLVGQGPERDKLEELCRGLGVSSAVRFTGQRSNREVLEEMCSARFFVMPSVREGFGIVYTEAMACGCITVGTQGEGIADLIVSGENGFLVPPDDPQAIVQAVEWCLAHPEQAAAMAERGRRSALELTWAKNAAQYISLFEELRR